MQKMLYLTISQLDVGYVPSERALEMGQLGYMQWLGALPGKSCYRKEAALAHDIAAPFRHSSPAISVFCDLIEVSLNNPLRPLPLALPQPQRRGGARARRGAL
ncbi:MAG: hypothetical protein AAF665_19285 [Pseudomonadota bacterium]